MNPDKRIYFSIAQLRHLYQMMLDGQVVDTAHAATFLLGPAIERFEDYLKNTDSFNLDKNELELLRESLLEYRSRVERGLVLMNKGNQTDETIKAGHAAILKDFDELYKKLQEPGKLK